MSLKECLKRIPFLYSTVKYLRYGIKDLGAIPKYMAERRIKRGDGPVRVGFICQYIPVWHKLQPIYERMRADSQFEPFLICVPSNIHDGELVEAETDNDTLEYFREHGYPEALNALQPDGTWLDLKKMDLAYVFYPRPYDAHMPKCYWSREVCCYSKICMILYGMNTTKEIVGITLNRSFFRHVYCYFAELPYSREQNKKMGWLLHLLGLQQSVYYGIPGIEAVREAIDLPRPAWEFAKGKLRVMWTPRWTTDPKLGGSNFFTYYQFLLDFAREHTDIDFLFRPHPLALQHFQQTGEMTKQEAEDFLAQCAALPNVSLDTEKEYAATFWGTDVLMSDTSGLIPEYFATGKPLIYCVTKMYLTPEPTSARILEGSYIVNNSQELAACLLQLQQGIDPLAEKRQQIVTELYGGKFANPAAKITEHLAHR